MKSISRKNVHIISIYYLESGENVPLDLGDTGQHIGGGDLTKRAWISVKEYSFPELVGLMDSSGDITAEDLNETKVF